MMDAAAAAASAGAVAPGAALQPGWAVLVECLKDLEPLPAAVQSRLNELRAIDEEVTGALLRCCRARRARAL
jgi:hypothetical protein